MGKPDFFLINKIIRSKTINNKKIYILFLEKVMMIRLIRGSKVKQSTASKKTKIKKIVKNLPKNVINALSEDVLNGLCGNIPLDKSDIEKLKPFRRLMKSLSNKSIKVGE